MPVPQNPKIYHIVHVDRLASIIAEGFLFSDAEISSRLQPCGTTIGMSDIKQRRLTTNLSSHPNLTVGQCVPFYFCPRSIMLYLISQRNHPDLAYKGGQGPIIHLEADLYKAVNWANLQGRRWAFTLSNAGSYYFEDRADLQQLGEINWDAVAATQWNSKEIMQGKQAEFLMERCFPWGLFERIGVKSQQVQDTVLMALGKYAHRPLVDIKPDWYY